MSQEDDSEYPEHRKPKVIEDYVCIDDGTGRNLFYLGDGGKVRTRNLPANFKPELFENGQRRYYFKGMCLRCKNSAFPVVLHRNKGYETFSFNMCESCLLKVSPGITRLRGNGDYVYSKALGMPQIMYNNSYSQLLSPNRTNLIYERAKEARKYVQLTAKLRRNAIREKKCKVAALQYPECPREGGHYLSWGFDNTFDEYFGHVDATRTHPDGVGVMFYSEGTIYIGGWKKGKMHSEFKSTWTRPDGSQYEGQWVGGRKHGVGTQVYPSGCRYHGEFANGFEHGHGKRNYPDDSTFEGRFRFGRRDGPGALTMPNGHVDKRNFRDNETTNEKMPPEMEVEEDTSEQTGGQSSQSSSPLFSNPPTLLELATAAAAHTMHHKRACAPPEVIQRRLCTSLKELVVVKYISTIRMSKPKTAPAEKKSKKKDPGQTVVPAADEPSVFLTTMISYAFKNHPSINMNSVCLNYSQMEAILYLEQSNIALTELSLVCNKLDSLSLTALGHYISEEQLAASSSSSSHSFWPLLENINLSFNTIDNNAMQSLSSGIFTYARNLTVVKMSGCSITPATLHSFTSMLETNDHIVDLDLSFNDIGPTGAFSLGVVLKRNTTLTALNVRRNKMDYTGGKALADALIKNKTLKVLNCADNNVGEEVIVLISGRLNGTIKDIVTSVCTREIYLPVWYEEGRFSGWQPPLPKFLMEDKKSKEMQEDMGSPMSQDEAGGGVCYQGDPNLVSKEVDPNACPPIPTGAVPASQIVPPLIIKGDDVVESGGKLM